jgi:uncharacterized small protein (DUF1192 family)
MVRSTSTDSITSAGTRGEPILGLSSDPERDVNDMVGELRAEVMRVKAEQDAKNKRNAMAKAKAKAS